MKEITKKRLTEAALYIIPLLLINRVAMYLCIKGFDSQSNAGFFMFMAGIVLHLLFILYCIVIVFINETRITSMFDHLRNKWHIAIKPIVKLWNWATTR